MRGLTGRYRPGDSVIHRADARVKIIALSGWLAAVFAARRPGGFAALALIFVMAVAISRIPARLVLSPLRPVAPLMALTMIFPAFSLPGSPLLRLGPFAASREGVILGAVYGARLLLAAWGAAWLTWTTTPTRLADGLGRLLRPLGRIGFPAPEAALVLTLALRFVPAVRDEWTRVRDGMTARGLGPGRVSWRRRLNVLGFMMVPLFTGTLRLSDGLAAALEMRGWCGRAAGVSTRVPRLQWMMAVIGWAAFGLSLWLWR